MKIPASVSDTCTLLNGREIPCVGFGTFLTPDGQVAFDSVSAALAAGYRHIDTASYYGNEASVGRAVRESGLPRDEVFITTKLWNADQGYEPTLRAFDRSMELLGLDYLDLYLIHWPRSKGREQEWASLNRSSWQAMTELYRAGRIKAIGVSNFRPHHIVSLMEEAELMPMVNQIELHPGLLQTGTVEFCREHGIVVEAWGPFSRGNLFGSGLMDAMAARYGRSVAQVTLRWHLQHGYIPLPKSVKPARISENTRLFDFELSDADMAAIDSITTDTGTGYDPDTAAY